jgi:hypothetical protein
MDQQMAAEELQQVHRKAKEAESRSMSVPYYMELLESAIGQLVQRTEELFGRLAPVTRPVVDETFAKDKTTKVPACQLAERLNECCNRVSTLTIDVQGQLERLEM